MDFNEIDRKYYFGGELGAVLSGDRTLFSVWAPLGEAVELRLYGSQTNPPSEILPMTLGESGVWQYNYPKRLDGIYYTYAFTYNGVTRECTDIYARAAGANGIELRRHERIHNMERE